METLATISMWVMHWALQGLKLWLFAIVALMGAFIGCVPFAILDGALKRFVEPSQVTNIASVVISGFGLIVALAVGAATLASMLNDHPLKPFSRKQTGEAKPTSRTSRSTTTA